MPSPLGAAHVIFATNVFISTTALLTTFGNLEALTQPFIDQGNLTAVEDALLLSPQALQVQIVLSNIKLDWRANVANVITYANGNVSLFSQYLTGEVFTSLTQLFTNYHFEPSVSLHLLRKRLLSELTEGYALQEESYHLINEALNQADEAAAGHLQDEYVVTLMKPVYVSMQYGLSVLGGVFVCLGLLSILQHGPASFHHLRHAPHKKRSLLFYHRISMFYRFGLGIVLLLLTLLDIGPFWNNADQTGPAAPIFKLMDSTVYLPLLFLIALSAAILDFVSHLLLRCA